MTDPIQKAIELLYVAKSFYGTDDGIKAIDAAQGSLLALQTSRPDAGDDDLLGNLQEFITLKGQRDGCSLEEIFKFKIVTSAIFDYLQERNLIRAALKSGDKGRWQDKYGYMPVGEAIEHAHAMREKYLAEHDGDEPATAEIVRWYCSEAHRLSKSFAPPTSEGV